MSDLQLKIPNFLGGVVKNEAPELLQPNQLADAENFLPYGAQGAAQKQKVWHKDLLNVVGSTDDRIYTGNNAFHAVILSATIAAGNVTLTDTRNPSTTAPTSGTVLLRIGWGGAGSYPYSWVSFDAATWTPTEYAATTWAGGTAYVTGDVVVYSGVVYVAIASTTGNTPNVSPTKWESISYSVVNSAPYPSTLSIKLSGGTNASAVLVLYGTQTINGSPVSGTSITADGYTFHPDYLETSDPYLPRFDLIDEVYYFYSNNFDNGTNNYGSPTANPNAPISVSGNNWLTTYGTFDPTNVADVRAGFYLYKDVLLTTTLPLRVSIPFKQNGAFVGQSITATIYYIDGTSTTLASTQSVDLGNGGFGRIEFSFTPGANTTLYAGEYYIKFAQADTGYSYVIPPGYSDSLYGWAQDSLTSITGEAVADGYNLVALATNAVNHTLSGYSTTQYSIPGTLTYHGSIVYTLKGKWNGNVGSGSYLLTVTVNLDTSTQSYSASAYNGATSYVPGDIVSSGGNYFISTHTGSGFAPATGDTTKWRWISLKSQTYDATTKYPISSKFQFEDSTTIFGVTVTYWSTSSIFAFASIALQAATAVTANYSTATDFKLAEMMVYQRPSEATALAMSATNLYKGQRYTKKNTAMPGGATVQTDTEVPVWYLSDKHSFFALYQTVEQANAAADAQMVSGTIFNAADQYARWYDGSGNQAATYNRYYLPKWIGEVRCFANFQNRSIFGGVGGLAIFDPHNILEASPYAGKIHTPWRDVVIPNTGLRLDSQYLQNAGNATVNVHPSVVNAMFVYGDQPGHLVVCTQDYVVFAGGSTVGTASNVWTFQALSSTQIGEGSDLIKWGIYFDQRGLIGTKRGDVYEITGTVPVDWASGTNTLNIRKVRNLRDLDGPIVFTQVVDTGLGYMIACDNRGNLYTMDGSLIPQPFGEAVTVYGGDKVNINVAGFSWDSRTRRLWIHSDGFQARGYYVSTTFTPVDVSARSFVWDADTKSFWPVCNPLDSDARTNKPTVFRDGNVSWSCGYYFDGATQGYTFYLECDIAGLDPLPLHNSNEALYQPENSTKHATSTTAYLLTKLMTSDDHSVQVRYLQALARLIDGTQCTLSVVCEGVTTSLGTFNTSTDFATLAHKLATLRINATARVNSMQIKLSITNQYADVVHNLMVKSDLSGWPV